MDVPEPTLPIDAAVRAAIVGRLAEKLRANYVFSDVGERMARHLTDRLAAGAYDGAETAEAFCALVTDDMQEISHDLHLRLRYSAEPRRLIDEAQLHENPEYQAEYHEEAATRNYGYRRVERLAGNIGYIEQDGLHDAVVASEAATHAFNLIADTDALVLDLRRNGGGDPRHVAVICSYLTEAKPTHLNSFVSREAGVEKVEQFWTWPWVPGRRYLDRPVYVLTSAYTFSGAEELSYNLKVMGRATLIGETTGGGAHPVGMHQLSEHFTVSISFARALNPITETNWEGTGVAPDIAVPADEAFDVAYRLALQAVLERAPQRRPAVRARLEREIREALGQGDH